MKFCVVPKFKSDPPLFPTLTSTEYKVEREREREREREEIQDFLGVCWGRRRRNRKAESEIAVSSLSLFLATAGGRDEPKRG